MTPPSDEQIEMLRARLQEAARRENSDISEHEVDEVVETMIRLFNAGDSPSDITTSMKIALVSAGHPEVANTLVRVDVIFTSTTMALGIGFVPETGYGMNNISDETRKLIYDALYTVLTVIEFPVKRDANGHIGIDVEKAKEMVEAMGRDMADGHPPSLNLGDIELPPDPWIDAVAAFRAEIDERYTDVVEDPNSPSSKWFGREEDGNT